MLENIDQLIQEFVSTYLPFLPDAYLAVTVVVVTGIFLLSYIANPIIEFASKLRNFFKKKDVQPRDLPVRSNIRVLRDVWLKDRKPDGVKNTNTSYPHTEVITLLNMKGGVGKTTLTANIGASLASAGKKVLYIDYDYQGTLSLMVSGAVMQSRRDIAANSYMTLYPAASNDPDDVYRALPAPLGGCGIAGSSYQLFRDEMEQFARWSSGNSDHDARVQLKGFLSTESIQEKFDVVLIDCGPRFTTSTINALCSSTHFLVPTILDEASTQAVSYLEKELSAHQSELFPQLKCLGVIPTMITYDNRFVPREEEQIDFISHKFERFADGDVFLGSARVPRRASISRAANKIAYFEEKRIRVIFDRATELLLERLSK